jgi:hypothetical protein
MIEGFFGSCSTLLEFQKIDSFGSLHQYICIWMNIETNCCFDTWSGDIWLRNPFHLEMKFWVTNLKTVTVELQVRFYDTKISFFPLINIKFPLRDNLERPACFLNKTSYVVCNHKFCDNILQLLVVILIMAVCCFTIMNSDLFTFYLHFMILRKDISNSRTKSEGLDF